MGAGLTQRGGLAPEGAWMGHPGVVAAKEGLAEREAWGCERAGV